MTECRRGLLESGGETEWVLDTQNQQAFIRAKALENQHTPARDKVLWSRHAVGKLVAQGLQRSHVEIALQTCKVIEDCAAMGRPLPDCLALGYWQERPIHGVVAMDVDQDRIFVVTVYVPSSERWNDGWQSRK
jgi:hypothetical protein